MLKTLPASPTPQTCFLNKQTSGTPLIEMSYLCRSDLRNRCVAETEIGTLTQFMIKTISLLQSLYLIFFFIKETYCILNVYPNKCGLNNYYLQDAYNVSRR